MIQHQDFKSRSYIDYSYKNRGVYHEQLKRYYDLFPKSNLLVLTSESLFARPHETLRRVLGFVGVDEGFTVPNLRPRNTGGNRVDVDPGVYEELRAFFRPHNEKLYTMVGEDFGWA